MARSSLTCAASGSSPTSSRNSVPPDGFDELAGMPLGRAGERALLVAEQDRFHEIVRDRAAIDRDERLRPALAGAVDGARDQLLADAGLALDQHRNGGGRGLLGGAQHACMRALRVTMSLKVSVPARLRLMRASSPSSALVASALRSDTCRRSAPTGLTTKSAAPARMADDHVVDAAVRGLHDHRDASSPASRIRASTPRPSRSGITRSSTTQSMRRAVGAGEQRGGRSPPSASDRLVAELAHHVVEQPALHRIVIDDENTLDHVRNLRTQVRTDRNLGNR